MPSRSRAALGSLLLPALLGSCAQYGRALMEFDSATGFDAVATEPEVLEFRSEATRWPWLVRQLEGSGLDVAIATTFSLEPGPKELSNPSEFVRERVDEIVELSGDDVHRTAQVARRLVWLADHDPQTLDRLVTLDGIEQLLARLRSDPLQVPFVSVDRAGDVERRTEWLETLDRLAPGARPAGRLEGDQREIYLAALRGLAERPSPSSRADRSAMLAMDRALVQEDDGALREATAVALVEVMENALANTLRSSLLSPLPEVREAALLALYRLSGPAAVPFALFALERTTPERGSNEYDNDENLRRTLLQLCAGLPPEWLQATFGSGPPPIEFVYDTAVRDESRGLRRVGLDALARCLGRPVEFDRTWADEWWRERAIRGDDELVPREPARAPQ